jgi:hypothetical protein
MQRFEDPTKVRYTHIYHLFETSPFTEQSYFFVRLHVWLTIRQITEMSRLVSVNVSLTESKNQSVEYPD